MRETDSCAFRNRETESEHISATPHTSLNTLADKDLDFECNKKTTKKEVVQKCLLKKG